MSHAENARIEAVATEIHGLAPSLAGTNCDPLALAVRVVVVSPYPAELSALEELLRDEGHEVRSASTRAEGVAQVRASRPDAVIADAQLTGLDGRAWLRELSILDPPPRTILLCPRSNHGLVPPEIVCMTKPIDLRQLFDHLARLSLARAKVA